MKKIIVLCWSIIMVLTFTACVRFEVRGKANTTKLSSEEIEINKSVVFEGENKIDIDVGCGVVKLSGYEGDEVIVSGITNLAEEDIILTKGNNTIKIKDNSDDLIDLFGNNDYILELEIKIPYSFNGDLDYDFGVGENEIRDITCNKLTIDGGTGELTIDDIVFNKLDFDSGVGHSNINLVRKCGDIDIDGGVGDIYISLAEVGGNLTFESGVGSGEIKIPHKPMNLQEVISGCIEIISPQLIEKGITLETEFNDNDINNVYGSSLHFRQVLLNVLSNAYKYNVKNGKIFFKIDKLGVENNIVTYKYTISDTGIGMSEEFQKKLFTPFSQENEGKRSEYGGTGLGLSIVKRIVDIIGGTIKVSSKKNEGTTFEITLPFEIYFNKNEVETQNNEIDVSLLNNINVLLVEDNDLNMEIAAYILEENGINVTKAMNGEEAIKAFEDSKVNYFDIILMDVMMPVLDGCEATKRIRKLNRKDAKKVPIFAMTANAFAEDVEATKEAGMNEHITKPIDNKELLSKMCKYLRKNEKRGRK